ncbi:MAG: hypothetical protein QNJ00_08280 [Woeseiaceae bacterium]|nr:hypothetical protein [Woeseiaceae bacterium]
MTHVRTTIRGLAAGFMLAAAMAVHADPLPQDDEAAAATDDLIEEIIVIGKPRDFNKALKAELEKTLDEWQERQAAEELTRAEMQEEASRIRFGYKPDEDDLDAPDYQRLPLDVVQPASFFSLGF